MKNYLNHTPETNQSFTKEPKLKFINTIILEAFSSSENNIIKNPRTPPKIKSDKPILFINKNIIDKEKASDIDTTRNMSEKNTCKYCSRKDLKNEDENNRYIDIKDGNNDLTTEKNENKTNVNIKRDIFGTEIKKGGNHKISFADNAHILRAREKLPNIGNSLYRNRHRGSAEFYNINNDNNSIKKIRSIRRSILGLKNDKLKRKYDIENSDKKIIKSLVEVIEIQNYKEFNKITDYFIPEENENVKDLQETVCCSGTCLIY